MINRLHIRQVLEVAGGLTLRGLAATADPNVVYVDTDLNDLTREKSDLALDISSCHRLSARGNFHLASANALELNSLVAAVNGIFRDGEPIAVVQEGLLPYLTALEIETVARNIRALLQKFGGAWITSDFTLKSDATPVTEQQRRFREIVSAATDVKMYNNAFDDAEQLDFYFGRFGFQMEVYNQLDLAPQLSSADLIPQAQLEEFKPRLRLWVLRLAG
jgi:O-methyltransferase involved in polyketide biosynthesis